ncbi:tyrosine-protein phosphatase non-receptor type 9 [Nephila pilipes]|uniref:Tyrosine-protein phosphatase non-receptor type 9 n=1 Tax=Nephila pilipes TaxID=299642 RepID=A0A8X6Q363_NEPPI|nr:tyrosine-protein phosphatase non-receptor type 9 [Nephila pilipes]
MIIIAPAMATSLTTDEELAVQQFITVVNELRRGQNIGPLSWSTAVKFMMARKFDVHRALQLYETHEIIRRKEGLIRFDPNCDPLKSELETGKFTILPTRDPGGAALALFSAGKHNPFLSSHNVTLQGVVYQLDVALESFQTQRCGVVFIYNMNDSKYSNFDYELSQKMLTLLKGGYPARLKKVLIVTAPLWFKAPFKILRLFVREKLRDRVYMVNVPQLSLHVPLSSLPQELGGNLQIDHQAWLLHCLKSMANRCGDLFDLVSAPTSPTALHDPFSPQVVHNNGLTVHHFQFGSSEGETDESSEHQNSVHEKQNSEDREKEVEVIKEISLTVQDKPVPSCSPLQEVMPNEEKSSSTPTSSLSEDSLHSDLDSGMSIEEFIEHLQKKGKRGLYEEYADIKSKTSEGTFESSRLKSNQSKNRYSDVLCYDHTRVKISCVDSDPCSDYLNANFVDGFCQKNAFISTQGPLPKTFPDFWRMVWEFQVGVIVMTTRTIERSRAKCGQYWPKEEESSEEYGTFSVYNEAVEHCNDYTITNLTVMDTKTKSSRKVFHMQFTSWPDYGVPGSALAMLGFRDKVRDKQKDHLACMVDKWSGHPNGPPIVVHCSAGIGRTGTFITLDISICRLEATGLIDVRTTVEKIRSQRAHSIQMPDQYVFCHLALLEYALSHRLLQDVDLTGFNDSDSESE